jgi:hypothetical protein
MESDHPGPIPLHPALLSPGGVLSIINADERQENHQLWKRPRLRHLAFLMPALVSPKVVTTLKPRASPAVALSAVLLIQEPCPMGKYGREDAGDMMMTGTSLCFGKMICTSSTDPLEAELCHGNM